jgi:hypothetical protein
MGLSRIFQKAAKTAFKAAGDLPKSVTYREVVDDGFSPKVETDYPAKMLFESLTENSRKSYSFADKVQPNDYVGLIPSLEITTDPKVGSLIIQGAVTYNIIARDRDAAGALYVLLLRNA